MILKWTLRSRFAWQVCDIVHGRRDVVSKPPPDPASSCLPASGRWWADGARCSLGRQRRWCLPFLLPDEMGKVNIGLAGRSINKLVITTSQGELFRQVVIDKAVDNTTGHALLKSLLGDGYRVLLPCIVKLRNKHTWLQICDSSQWVPPYL